MRVTEQIKNSLDIVDIVSESVQLRKSGRSYSGFCPFHQNTRTPAFVVFPDTQTWRCFGACAEGGDIFSFVMKKEGMDFKEALVTLAQQAGITLEPTTRKNKKKQAYEDKLTDLITAAADYFHQLFLHAPQAAAARQYIEERGFNEQTIADFRIGFALNSWDACRTHFDAQGYSDQDLLAVGLLTENEEKGTRYDRFRNRLMIPIRALDGRIVGFGARTLAKDGIPKYLNSPQTALFNKSHLLFGLDMARRHVREARQAVIVEGYMDVIQAWQAGFRNVVAQMGTALTEQQLRLLKRYTKRFVLALDADVAGMRATMRSLEVARGTLDREVETRFDARGLVKHEGRLQADIRIVTLPPGEDPDSIIRTNLALWPKLVAQAQPVVAYVIGMLTQELDLTDAKAKTAVAQQVLPLIKDIVNPVERDHYWQQLARALQTDERALRQLQPVQSRRTTPQPPAAARRLPPELGIMMQRPSKSDHQAGAVHSALDGAIQMREANFLRQCLHQLLILRQVNQKLQQHQQPAVSERDFSSSEDGLLIRQMYHWVADGLVAPTDEMWDSLSDILQERARSLREVPPSATEQDRIVDTLVLSVLDWRLEKVKQQLAEVRRLFDEARSGDDTDALALYKDQLRELPVAILHLNKAKDAMSAVSKRRVEELS